MLTCSICHRKGHNARTCAARRGSRPPAVDNGDASAQQGFVSNLPGLSGYYVFMSLLFNLIQEVEALAPIQAATANEATDGSPQTAPVHQESPAGTTPG